MFNYLLIFCFSIIVSLSAISIVKRIFQKYNILDNPKKYWLKRKAIPYSMWVIFFISFFIVSFLATQVGFLEYNFKLGLIWVFWFFITAISFMDDMLDVSAKVRLIFQIIIWAIIGITSIKIGYISNIFWWIINLETYHFSIMEHTIYIIPLLFTIIWYVFIFNALNWTDWVQWNTSGLSIISFSILFALWIILFYRDNYEWGIENAKFIMWISIILVWILIPFWYFDFKERILMW